MRTDHLSSTDKRRMEKRLKYPYSAIWIIGTESGLRISDILELTVEQVKNGRPTIKIKKTKKSKRIYIPKRAQKEILANCPESGTVFNITRQAVFKTFKKTATDLNIKAVVGTHTMRKTYAWKLKEKGKSYTYIQGKLQHQSLGDTLRYLA